MKYDLTKPCSNCPFRNDIKPFLSKARAKQISSGLLNNIPFTCHKTTTEKGLSVDNRNTRHCAGALIVLEKLGQPHQMMRISERLGLYDCRKLEMESPVFDNFKQFIKANNESF